MTMRARIFLSLFFVALTSFASGSASAQLSTWHPCGSAPAANEIYVFSDPNLNFSKSCAALSIGFYPYPGQVTGGFGISNDNISSIWVGSNARARVYISNIYSGGTLAEPYLQYPPGQYLSLPGNWDNQISSIRVFDNSRSANCDDLQPGEFALFNQLNFTQRPEVRGIPIPLDCVVLRYEINGVAQLYPRPEEMGIGNDSVWSILAGPADPNVPAGWVISTIIYKDNNFANRAMLATSPGGASIPDLSASPWFFNSAISSIKVIYQAIVP